MEILKIIPLYFSYLCISWFSFSIVNAEDLENVLAIL